MYTDVQSHRISTLKIVKTGDSLNINKEIDYDTFIL